MKTRNVMVSLALALGACSDKAAQRAELEAQVAARQQAELAKIVAASQALGADAGPLVRWQDLAPFIPNQLGAFVAQGETEGELTDFAGSQVSRAFRKYVAGGMTLFVTITDASAAGPVRAPFAMAPTLNEDSSHGYKKGQRIGDHPAIAFWDLRSRHSEVAVLVAGRYVVKIDVRDAASGGEAEKLAVMLDLDRLAKLAARAP